MITADMKVGSVIRKYPEQGEFSCAMESATAVEAKTQLKKLQRGTTQIWMRC